VAELEPELDLELDFETAAPAGGPAGLADQAQRQLERAAGFNLDETLMAWERAYIEAALRITRGNMSQAAKLLGVNRTTLYSRMDQKEPK
jgi:DNA-binding NtrC family response regulator